MIAFLLLTILGRPDPPYDLRWVSCQSRSAEIQWEAGSENNALIREFIVHYNTSFEPDAFLEANRVPANVLRSKVGPIDRSISYIEIDLINQTNQFANFGRNSFSN